jgi:exonuclease SbcD
MKLLHTADWHVGKVLKNQPRFDEHKAALADLVRIADAEDVDAVIVAGDLFETSTPNPAAQALVMNTLLALRGENREVVVLAGNHDNPKLIDEVYRPVLGRLGVHVLGQPRRPDRGGTLSLPMRTGETAKIAALPFLSYRFAVRAAEVVLHESAEHSMDYARRVGAIIGALTSEFTGDTVNIVTTHCTVLGGRRGGGEREVQTLLGYELPAQVFPASAHYAALGHLHRYQEIDGPCPIAYSGSPLALDFGEETNESMALVVTATPGSRAHVRPVPVAGGRPLRTLHGSLDYVIEQGQEVGDAFLRVILEEKARAGLADLVRDALPNVLDVQLDEKYRARPESEGLTGATRLDRPPAELFADFLAEQNIEDPRVGAMFAELLEDATGGGA